MNKKTLNMLIKTRTVVGIFIIILVVGIGVNSLVDDTIDLFGKDICKEIINQSAINTNNGFVDNNGLEYTECAVFINNSIKTFYVNREMQKDNSFFID